MIKENQKIKIDRVPVTDLKISEYNPRHWSKEQFDNLKKSIERFGIIDPIIVNNNEKRYGTVIGGHFRLEVAKKLGFTEIPVIFLNISDLKTEKELNLRLNCNTGEWDYDLLKTFQTDMLIDVGFDNDDLSKIFDENLETKDDDFNVQKEIEKIKEPKTRKGDIFQLGSHILTCNDSTNPEVVKKLSKDKVVDMIYCDPPFNINLNYNRGVGGKGNYGGKINDHKSEKEYIGFLRKALQNAISISKPDSHFFLWNDQSNVGIVQSLFRELNIDYKRTCLWIKNSLGLTPNIAFNKCQEDCIYGVIGKPYISDNLRNLNEIMNKEVGSGNQTIDDILDIINIWLVKRLPGGQYEHPTEKPPSLHEKALKRCTKINDTVLDLFGGSGSTLIACQQLKRKCLMVEIEPIFCDLIISRFEKLTGKKAYLLNGHHEN